MKSDSGYVDRDNAVFTKSQRRYVEWLRNENSVFDPTDNYERQLRRRMRERVEDTIIDFSKFDTRYHPFTLAAFEELIDYFEEHFEDEEIDPSEEARDIADGIVNLQALIARAVVFSEPSSAAAGIELYTEFIMEGFSRAFTQMALDLGLHLSPGDRFEVEIRPVGDWDNIDLAQVKAALEVGEPDRFLDGPEDIETALLELLVTGRMSREEIAELVEKHDLPDVEWLP